VDSNPSQVRRVVLDILGPLVRGRTVFLTGSAVGSHRMARLLADAGAEPVSVDLGAVPDDTRERFSAYERLLVQPTETIRARLDAKDPDGAALVYAGSFTTAKDLCGRRVIGARSLKHLDAERKDRQRELLGVSGDVVGLADCFRHLSVPAVVQGIPDQGVAMATSHTYLVPRSADSHRVRALAATLMRDCTRVVVSGFNAGLPCTFYGFITATTIVDFGPVEALVYWDPHTWRIYAPGILRPLQTAESVIASARSEVHVIAQRLRQRLGYVGAFGTDGVLTDGGYAIHELNPRVCAGFNLLDQLVPNEAPLSAIDLVLRELPGISTKALTASLATLSIALQQDRTPNCMLWEASINNLPAPADQTDQSAWAERTRKTAAQGRPSIVDLGELAYGIDLS